MGFLRTAVQDAGFVSAKEERVVNMLMQKNPVSLQSSIHFQAVRG
jgi:hypothetical protein